MTKLHELRSTISCNGEANFRSRSDEHLGETPLIEWNSLTSRLIFFHWLNQCHSRLSLSTTRISWLSLFSHTRYRKVWKMTFCSKIKIVKTKGSEKKKNWKVYIRTKEDFPHKLWSHHLFFLSFPLWPSIFQSCPYSTNQSQLAINLVTKDWKKKEIGKYKDKSQLLQTLKLPSIFHLFFTLILHLSIMLLFNKLEPNDWI